MSGSLEESGSGHGSGQMGLTGRKEAFLENLVLVAKALANPKRLLLIDILAQGERNVESLARASGLRVTTASVHLHALRDGGLVVSRRVGARTLYRLAGDDVLELHVLLGAVARAHVAATERAEAGYLGDDDHGCLSRMETLARLVSGVAVVVDVRPADEYALGHIPGAVSMPLPGLGERLTELPPDREVIVYGRGAYCAFAHEAARFLGSRGRTVLRLEGGIIEWRLAGMPLMTSP